MFRKSILALSLCLAAALLVAPAAKAANLALDGNLIGLCGTATASGNGTAATATLANKCGVITTESLTGPTSSTYTLTLTNTVVTTTDIILFSVANGTSTTGTPMPGTATPGSGSAVITIKQPNTTNFNGTLTIRYFVIKP